jgi:uncharacterized damage-inducible protein DinB
MDKDRRTCILLTEEMDEAWETLQKRVERVTEEEFWWEPGENTWGIREANGVWQVDYDIPNSIPKGPLTIGWLMAHISHCKLMYYECAFGEGKMDWDDLTTPSSLSEMKPYLEESQKPLREVLDTLQDSDLEILRSTNWGEEKSTWWILWTMIYHDIYHGAQIEATRKIYRSKHKLPI